MSRARLDLQRRKLSKALSRADDELFIRMIWAVDALQTGRAEAASRFLLFPSEAATKDIASKYAVHKWELESLMGLLLTTPKATTKAHDKLSRTLRHDNFMTVTTIVNLLRRIEDADAGIYLKNMSIFDEIHRLSHRTFPWQIGYFNLPQFYRFAFIYAQGESAAYFKETYNVDINTFSLVGFALHQLFQTSPRVDHNICLDIVGVSREDIQSVLKLLRIPIEMAKTEAAALLESAEKKYERFKVAYRPSILRKFPIISTSNNSALMSPIPELIIQRITSGIYYDLLNGGGNLRNEAAKRFENYCQELLRTTMPKLKVSGSYKYKCNGNNIDSTDIIVKNDQMVVLAIECKARKLTIGAQFSDNPLHQAKDEYDEIVKGVCQLWRYLSHIRRISITRSEVSCPTMGIVLTLDSWLSMSHELRGNVIQKAKDKARRYPDISHDDQISIVFCSVEEFERTLLKSNEESFLATVRAAGEPQFSGWPLDRVHDQLHKELEIQKPFPFNLEDVLPWKKMLGELIQQQKSTSC